MKICFFLHFNCRFLSKILDLRFWSLGDVILLLKLLISQVAYRHKTKQKFIKAIVGIVQSKSKCSTPLVVIGNLLNNIIGYIKNQSWSLIRNYIYHLFTEMVIQKVLLQKSCQSERFYIFYSNKNVKIKKKVNNIIPQYTLELFSLKNHISEKGIY